MNTRTSVVLLLIGLALALSGTALGQSPPPAAPCFYTEAQLTELLKEIFFNSLGDTSEKLIFITEDGQVIIIEDSNPKGVAVTIHDIIIALALKGQHMGTVTNIIHNHERKTDFNEVDAAACKTLRKAGFTGKFQIYHPVSWRIKTLKRKE